VKPIMSGVAFFSRLVVITLGTMILVFDEPVSPVTKDPEGVFRAGNKMRLLKLGASLSGGEVRG